jgi:hypothetical protein
MASSVRRSRRADRCLEGPVHRSLDSVIERMMDAAHDPAAEKSIDVEEHRTEDAASVTRQ